MKILIQSTLTHLFYNLKTGKWVATTTAATAFDTSREAIRVCFQLGLTDVQLVVEAPADLEELKFAVQVA